MGLQFVNHSEITDDDILAANKTYGSLGELAIMVLPQSQIAPLIRKFDLSKQGGLSKKVQNGNNLKKYSFLLKMLI